MPTYLTSPQKEELLLSAKQLCNTLVRPPVKLDSTEFLLAYWTPEQLEIASKAVEFCDFGSAIYKDVRTQPRENFAPGFKLMSDNSLLVLEYRNHGGQNPMPARFCSRLDNEYTDRLVQYEQWLIQRAFEVGCLKLVIEHLFEKCASLEAMRYLFPGTLWLLNDRGMHDLASKVSEVKKAPALPTLRPDQRWRLRFINQWWAVRMLMDDLEGIQPPFETNGQTCHLTFDAGLSSTTGNLTPNPGDEPGQEWLFLKAWS